MAKKQNTKQDTRLHMAQPAEPSSLEAPSTNDIEAFASSAVVMAETTSQEDMDEAVGEAMTALLKVFGRAMEKDEVGLILQLAVKTAERGIVTGRLLAALDEGIEQGIFERKGEMISLIRETGA